MGRFCKNEHCLTVYGYYKIYLPNCETCKNRDNCKTDIDDDCFVFPSPTDPELDIGINIDHIVGIEKANCNLFGDAVILVLRKNLHYMHRDDLNKLFNFLEDRKRYDILLKLRYI